MATPQKQYFFTVFFQKIDKFFSKGGGNSPVWAKISRFTFFLKNRFHRQNPVFFALPTAEASVITKFSREMPAPTRNFFSFSPKNRFFFAVVGRGGLWKRTQKKRPHPLLKREWGPAIFFWGGMEQEQMAFLERCRGNQSITEHQQRIGWFRATTAVGAPRTVQMHQYSTNLLSFGCKQINSLVDSRCPRTHQDTNFFGISHIFKDLVKPPNIWRHFIHNFAGPPPQGWCCTAWHSPNSER